MGIMKKVNPNSISVGSGINSGSRNYILSCNSHRRTTSSKPIRVTCGGCNFVEKLKTYFDVSCEHQPVSLNTLDPNFITQNIRFRRNTPDGRPPWNSSTHVGSREYSSPKGSNPIKGSKNTTQHSKSQFASTSSARDSLWAFYLLELPQPIRSTCLGYTNAGSFVIGDVSEFNCRPPAGLPNQKSDSSVANCLNWNFTDVKRNLNKSVKFDIGKTLMSDASGTAFPA